MSLIDRNENTVEMPSEAPVSNTSFKSVFWVIKIIFSVIVLWSIAGIVGYFYYLDSHSIYVDNPTWTWIVFQIWDMPPENLAAYSHTSLVLNPWRYTLKVDEKEVWSFEKWYLDFDAFLNPTNEIYIKEYLVYWSEKWYDKLPNNHIEVYWNPIDGPFEKLEWFYIKWSWNYDVDTEFPNEITLPKGSSYEIKSKIYRFDDFVDIYNTYYVEEEYEDESYSGSENTTN